MIREIPVPMRIGKNFKRELEKLQGKLLTEGKRVTLAELSDLIAEAIAFQDVERELLHSVNSLQKNQLFKVDRRRI